MTKQVILREPPGRWFNQVDNRWFKLGLTLLLVLFALSHSFTLFDLFDDESYIMMTMQTFFQGHRLYGETYSQYGPAFYFLQSPIHEMLHVPISHDIVRIKTICCWLAIAWLTGSLVSAVTGRRLLGVLGMLMAMLHLEKLGLEPAHPQEVIAVSSAAALWLFNQRHASWWMFAGICGAIIGLTKLNAGAILVLPLLFAAAWPLARQGSALPRKLGTILLGATGIACVMMPALLSWLRLYDLLTGGMDSRETPITILHLVWPLVMFGSAMTVCYLAWIRRGDSSNDSAGAPCGDQPFASRAWFNYACLIVGGIVMSTIIVAWILSRQTSWEELVWGVVKQHTFMTQSFFLAVSPTAIELVILSVLTIFCGLQCWFRQNRSFAFAYAAAPLALILTLVWMVKDCGLAMGNGYDPRGACRVLSFIGPLLMPTLLLRQVTTMRLAIAMQGCLGPLLAYPVSGTQLTMGTVASIVGLLILTNDAFESLSIPPMKTGSKRNETKTLAWERDAEKFGYTLSAFSIQWGVPVAIMGIVISTGTFGYRWLNNVPLDQPGCHWVRLPAPVCELEKGVANAIREVPGKQLAFDFKNLNRYFFWTGKTPLTAMNPTIWPKMLTVKQQLIMRDAIANADNVCIVRLYGENESLNDYSPDVSTEMFRGWRLQQTVGERAIGIRPGTTMPE